MVLDLRDAAWGDPADAVPVAELFMDGGVVATQVGRRVSETVLEAEAARSAWGGPLVVLVNAGTAGPGEIVAAALADSAHVPLVGEHTFGRAAESTPVALPEGGLVLTVAKYMSPSGLSIHGTGLDPSVAVSMDRDEDSAADEEEPEGARRDRILEKAIEVLNNRTEAEVAA